MTKRQQQQQTNKQTNKQTNEQRNIWKHNVPAKSSAMRVRFFAVAMCSGVFFFLSSALRSALAYNERETEPIQSDGETNDQQLI